MKRKSRSPKRYSRKLCKKGSISKRTYIVHSKKRGSYKVKASCIYLPKSNRARGKRSKRVLPHLKEGSLSKYGFHINASPKKRKSSLRKAEKVYGKSKLIKKLNAVRVLTKNTDPKASKIYTASIRYVQKM